MKTQHCITHILGTIIFFLIVMSFLSERDKERPLLGETFPFTLFLDFIAEILSFVLCMLFYFQSMIFHSINFNLFISTGVCCKPVSYVTSLLIMTM